MTGATNPAGHAVTFSRNAAASLARLLVGALIALFLPAYLTHRLPIQEYGAWVLILQLSAYVSYLDFGVQVGISKFVAEYAAKDDYAGAGASASAGLVIMTAASVIGCVLSILLAWHVPQMFHAMPQELYRNARVSIVLIGCSLAIGLSCSAFSAIFQGLQRYVVPMAIAVLTRFFTAAAVCLAVFLHGSLAVMGLMVAVVNIAMCVAQIVAWRKLASVVRIAFGAVHRAILKQMLEYCFVLAVWSAAMLCVTGLDLTIVGHYDFGQTAYYSVAVLPTNLVVMILSAALAPLIPAASALSAHRTPGEMGSLLSRATRYAAILLLLSGLPLLVCGYSILRIWVGPVYAQHCLPYLRILILANIIRNLCLPYATMVVAVGRQRVATLSAVSEAVVNLTASIYLASHIGAIGVAGHSVGISGERRIAFHCKHAVYLSGTLGIAEGPSVSCDSSRGGNGDSVGRALRYSMGSARRAFEWFGLYVLGDSDASADVGACFSQ